MKLIDIKKYYPNADYPQYLAKGEKIDKPKKSTIEVGMTMFNTKTKRLGLVLGCIDEFNDGILRLDSEGIVDISDLRFATDKEVEENVTFLNNEEDESVVVGRQTWTIELVTYADGTTRLNRTNDGFTAIELLGLANMSTHDILQQMASDITPKFINRKVVKD